MVDQSGGVDDWPVLNAHGELLGQDRFCDWVAVVGMVLTAQMTDEGQELYGNSKACSDARNSIHVIVAIDHFSRRYSTPLQFFVDGL